jgi:hypothetical protein
MQCDRNQRPAKKGCDREPHGRGQQDTRHEFDADDRDGYPSRRMQRRTDKPLRRSQAFSEKDAGEVSYGGQEGHEENKGNFWQRQLHVCNCHEHRQETPRQNQS